MLVPICLAGQVLALQLSGMSRLTNIDLAQFDPDEPLPEHRMPSFIRRQWRSVVRFVALESGFSFTGEVGTYGRNGLFEYRFGCTRGASIGYDYAHTLESFLRNNNRSLQAS